ncbi:hypothetical protein B0H19DRAFT_1055182 [Mycena capillaripes]|nr:hypothetical protein B0H19DRAFT_1055182 [Mycena capillaripes]
MRSTLVLSFLSAPLAFAFPSFVQPQKDLVLSVEFAYLWEQRCHRRTCLSGTQNQFESDSSPTRGDLYSSIDEYDNHDARVAYFEPQLKADNISGTVAQGIVEHRVSRWSQSVATNPYFFYGPVPMIISTLVHCFIPGIMANFDPSPPAGYFRSEDDLKILFGFTSDDSGALHYLHSHEQIPQNWFRRPTQYTHADAAPMIVVLGKADRRVLLPGGNMGSTKQYAVPNALLIFPTYFGVLPNFYRKFSDFPYDF